MAVIYDYYYYGDGRRYCMATAHRDTILTGKKAGGTSRYARKLAISRAPFPPPPTPPPSPPPTAPRRF